MIGLLEALDLSLQHELGGLIPERLEFDDLDGHGLS